MGHNRLILAIPQPCTEEWDMMSQNSTGRFCNLCNKTVLDFTHLSDSEIIKKINDQSGKICGRFYQDQLQREISYSPVNATNYRALYKLLVGLFFTLHEPTTGNAQPAATQQSPISYEEDCENVNLLPEVPRVDTAFSRYKGLIVDSSDKAIPFATVRLKGERKVVVCNEQGQFILHFPGSPAANCIIEVSAIGYKFKESTLLSYLPHNKVTMEKSTELGITVIAGGVWIKKTGKKNR